MNLEPYLINPDELQVGSIIFHIVAGPVRVTEITNNRSSFRCSNGSVYDRDGKYVNNNTYPSIYKSNPFEAPEPVVSEFPRRMRVRIREDGDWSERLVLCKHDDGVMALHEQDTLTDNGGSVKRTFYWRFFEEIPTIPKTVLSRADIARLAGCPVEELEILED